MEKVIIKANLENFALLLASANNDVKRLSGYADKLEAKLEKIREAIEPFDDKEKEIILAILDES